MKAFFLLLAIVAATQASPAWEQFKATHKKLYANSVEERARFAIFQQNLKEIEAHNELFKKGLVSWEKGVNQFTDMTQEEFLAYLKLAGPLPEMTDAVPFVADPNVQTPAKINWRDQGKVSKVKNQASCGSCWAFSTTGGIESQLLIKGRKDLLSEQQLVDCATVNYGCGGGWVDKALDYVKQNGLESEQDYPYTAKDGTCKYDASKVVTKIASYVSVHGDKDIENLVGNKGPTSVYVDATDFQTYKSGILDGNVRCSSSSYNHAVLIAGFDSENGKDFWLVKNSWGETWGESGYIRVARHKNLCNIEGYGFQPSLA